MSDTSGRSYYVQFAEYDPDSSSWKTWPATGLWGSTEYSATWPKRGMTQDGRASERRTSGPRTSENASGLLPTPEAKLSHLGPDYARANREGSGGDDLTTALHRLLPTPDTGHSPNGHGRRGGKPGNGHQSGADLESAVTLMPTPLARDAKGVAEREGGPNLPGALRQLGETTGRRSDGGSEPSDG